MAEGRGGEGAGLDVWERREVLVRDGEGKVCYDGPGLGGWWWELGECIFVRDGLFLRV